MTWLASIYMYLAKSDYPTNLLGKCHVFNFFKIWLPSKKSLGNWANKNKNRNRNKEAEINGLLRVYVTSTRLLLLALYWYSTIYIQSSANKHGNLPFSFDGLSHLVVSGEFTIAVWRNCCIKYHHHSSTVTRQNGVSKEVFFSVCASQV